MVDLDHYRGRAGEPFAAQAAEYFLRRQEQLLGVDDLVVAHVRREGGGVVAVGFEAAGGLDPHPHVVGPSAAEPRPLACGATTEERPLTYSLVGVHAG